MDHECVCCCRDLFRVTYFGSLTVNTVSRGMSIWKRFALSLACVTEAVLLKVPGLARAAIVFQRFFEAFRVFLRVTALPGTATFRLFLRFFKAARCAAASAALAQTDSSSVSSNRRAGSCQ